MHRIVYLKNFVSGPLTGLSVRCSLTVDCSCCAADQAWLNASTSEEPHADVLTGSQWWASGVGCEEIAA